MIYFAGEFFAEATFDAGALDFLLPGARPFVEAGFDFVDLTLAGADFVPVAIFFGVTFALEDLLLVGLACLAFATFTLDVFFAGEVLMVFFAVVVGFDAEGASGFFVVVGFFAPRAPAFSLEAFFGAVDLTVAPFLVRVPAFDAAFSLALDFVVFLAAGLTAESSSVLTLGANLTLPDGPLGKTKMCLSSPAFRAREIFETTDGVISML